MCNQDDEKLFDSGLGNPDSSVSSRSCIGNNNGGLGNQDYTYGFGLATDLLLALANYDYILKNLEGGDDYENRIYCHEDPLIYPILFNARHFIELSLKNNIEKFINLLYEFENLDKSENNKSNKFKHHCLGSFKSVDLVKSINTHSVLNLFQSLHKVSITIDREIDKFFQEHTVIETLINQLDFYDPNGETFRYRTSSDYKEDNLEKLGGLIDRQNFSNQFEKIKDFFEQLDFLLKVKISDFRTGTWTSKLSRNDLIIISKKLPNHIDWGNNEFETIKKSIMEEYDLSSNDFSKALDKIKENRYLMLNIGLEKQISGIDKNTLIKMMDYDEKSVCKFSIDELRVIINITELGQDDTYCEYYEYNYKNYSDDYLLQSVDYIIRKAIISSSQYFLRGLELLGQTTLINYYHKLDLPKSSKLWELQQEENKKKFHMKHHSFSK